MGEKAKKSRLAGIPAWAFSLMTLFLPVILFELFEHSQLPEPIDTDLVFIISYVIFVTAACFFICRTHPKSVWYTPFICNAVIIFFVIKDVVFGEISSEWIIMVSVIATSVIGAIVGTKIGQRKINQAK